MGLNSAMAGRKRVGLLVVVATTVLPVVSRGMILLIDDPGFQSRSILPGSLTSLRRKFARSNPDTRAARFGTLYRLV